MFWFAAGLFFGLVIGICGTALFFRNNATKGLAAAEKLNSGVKAAEGSVKKNIS